MHLFFLIESLQFIVLCMDGYFELSSLLLPPVASSKLIIFYTLVFYFEYFIKSVFDTFPALVSYGFDVIP